MFARRGLAILSLLLMIGGLAEVAADGRGTSWASAPLATPTPEPGVFRAYRVMLTPTIDGNLADWPVQGGIFLNSANASWAWGPEPFQGDGDGSLTCWSQWNESTLYLACAVRDDVLIADSGIETWLDDTVELAFDGQNDDVSFCGADFCPDDHRYELRIDGTVMDNTLPPNPPVTAAVAATDGGYNIEIAIASSNLTADTFVAGQRLGFNLGLTDDDDGGDLEGRLVWMGQYTWDHAQDYGDLVLDTQSAGPTPTPTATPSPTPTDTPTVTPTPTATPIPRLDLDSAVPIACGQSVDGDTRGAPQRVAVYGCVPWWPETGPEQVYALTLDGPVDLDAVLSVAVVDLDLFLLSDANPASCLAYGDNAVSQRAFGPGTYYLVVDGYEDAAGPYRLQVWCPLDPTPGPSPTPTVTPTATSVQPSLYLPLLRIDLNAASLWRPRAITVN